MPSPLVIVGHRLNEVGSDKLVLFAVGSVAAAVDPTRKKVVYNSLHTGLCGPPSIHDPTSSPTSA